MLSDAMYVCSKVTDACAVVCCIVGVTPAPKRKYF